jgi:hypothetical protein
MKVKEFLTMAVGQVSADEMVDLLESEVCMENEDGDELHVNDYFYDSHYKRMFLSLGRV